MAANTPHPRFAGVCPSAVLHPAQRTELQLPKDGLRSHHAVEAAPARVSGRQKGLVFLKRRTSSHSFASAFVSSRRCQPMDDPGRGADVVMLCGPNELSDKSLRGAYVVEMPEIVLQPL